tara:strand:- start:381 stop:710 length:330 start_codon:yes stop_codon:yes gene_type:complete
MIAQTHSKEQIQVISHKTGLSVEEVREHLSGNTEQVQHAHTLEEIRKIFYQATPGTPTKVRAQKKMFALITAMVNKANTQKELDTLSKQFGHFPEIGAQINKKKITLTL